MAEDEGEEGDCGIDESLEEDWGGGGGCHGGKEVSREMAVVVDVAMAGQGVSIVSVGRECKE